MSWAARCDVDRSPQLPTYCLGLEFVWNFLSHSLNLAAINLQKHFERETFVIFLHLFLLLLLYNPLQNSCSTFYEFFGVIKLADVVVVF